jgi:hypothetical protein
MGGGIRRLAGKSVKKLIGEGLDTVRAEFQTAKYGKCAEENGERQNH